MRLAFVVIGRNEGKRLERCLHSVIDPDQLTVYVDSGSTDGSVELARRLGAEVVHLDLEAPFTMARARNTGFRRAEELDGDLEMVHFVDGDCEVVEGWCDEALGALSGRPDVAAVCGHRRERFREASIYNRLADMDWQGPPGEIRFCGGDVLMRAEAFRQVGGYREEMIAGEDPEICLRLRTAGWRLLRLDHDMTLHDAAMTRFSQWWRRTLRTGHAYAEGAHLHAGSPERPWRRENVRNWFWGVCLPLTIASTAWITGGLSSLALLAYPIWVARIARGRVRRYGDRRSEAWLYGLFAMVGKVPMALGQARYWARRLTGRQRILIEYK